MPQSREFVLVFEVDRDFAAAFGRLAEVDFRAQGRAELLFERRQLFAAGLGDGAGIAVLVDDSQAVAVLRADAILHRLLGGADAPAFHVDAGGEANLFLLVAKRQQRPGMALRDFALLDHPLHVGRQLQQADQIRHGRAIDVDAGGDFFLRAMVLVDVPLERLRLFDRVEVLPLDVFDDGQLGHLAVVDVADLHRHLAPVGGLGGAEPALAGDELVAVADAADHQRLQDAVGADAVRQVGDLGLFERLPRLIRIGFDGDAVEPELAVLVAGRLRIERLLVSSDSPSTAGVASGSSHERPSKASKPRPKRRSLDTANPP